MSAGRPVNRDARGALPEGGFAVPMVLGFLVVLALLGGTAAVVTIGDLRSEGLRAAGAHAFDAAGSALEHGLLSFSEGAATWPIEGSVNGFAYRVDAVRDSFDFGAGRTPVWLDEEDPNPAFNGEGRGEPVLVLRAEASRGSFGAVQEQWAVRRAVPRIPAPLVVASRRATGWIGGWDLSGINVSEAGVPIDPSATDTAGFCGENRPALHVAPSAPAPTTALSLSGNGVYAGTSPAYTAQGPDPGWTSPEEVLGVPPGRLDSHRRSGFLHSLSAPDTLSGVVWITDRAGGPTTCLTDGPCAGIQGRGVLIVHNPRFDPRQHDPADPLYDAAIAANPAYGPARLLNIDGGTFRGILIADELPRSTTGPVRVQGAVIELSRRPPTVPAAWPASSWIRYSCPAIVDAARAAGSGPRLLGWKG